VFCVVRDIVGVAVLLMVVQRLRPFGGCAVFWLYSFFLALRLPESWERREWVVGSSSLKLQVKSQSWMSM